MHALRSKIQKVVPFSKVVFSALSILTFATSAHANLVLNGNFSSLLVPGHSSEFGSAYPAQQVTDWATSGYNLVFTSGSADTTGAPSQFFQPAPHQNLPAIVKLWGPGDGSNNGLPASSPDGGNFVAIDGAFNVAPITQTIHGLIPGKPTAVSFYWAGAQQYTYTGMTTEQFEVSLGSVHKFTPVLQNASHGFTGWQHESFVFVPTQTSELLSFLAIGTPSGVPPFSVLDGVSVDTLTPEPGSWGMALAAFGSLAAFARFRRKSR